MPTQTKEQLAADILKQHKASKAQIEQARKARQGAKLAREGGTSRKVVTTPTNASAPTTKPSSELAGIGGVSFRAADYMTGDIWVPDERIPAIDEAVYESRKTKAEGQKRSIEVASLNLSNIQGLHKLEGQSIDIAIAAQTNQTRYAKLEGAELDYQTQVQLNGAKSQKLTQATEAHQFATRETGYLNQQIGIRDSDYRLQIQQAETVLSEKSARYQAALSGN
jgi:hypothetical protein